MGKVSLVPFYIAQLPFAIAAELLFNKKIGESTETIQAAPKEEGSQEIVQSSPKVHTIIQTAEPSVSIPQVLGEVMAGLPKENGQPVFINVNVNTQQAAQTSTADSSPQTVTPIPKPSILATSQVSGFLSNILKWVREHKIKSALSCGAFIYGGLHLYLWYASHALSKATWSQWKSLCSLSDLYQMNQNELLKSLLSSLEETYQNKNPFLNAQRFIKEATFELKLLSSYAGIVNFIDRWYLRRFFFVNRSSLASIPERMQRLEFLKNTTAGWSNEHQKNYNYDNLFK